MDGIVLVDKPKGWTSFDVVAKLRNLTREKKVGHAGTLDPMATGLLALFFGSSTKTISQFVTGNKSYIGEITLGITTDSLDADGQVLEENVVDADLSEAALIDVFQRFVGEIKQVPPMVSAKHYKGMRLYELARKGIIVEREAFRTTIHELSLQGYTKGQFPKIKFSCACSKGTYVRVLAQDIGEALGCGAHLSSLRRVYSHPFSIEQAKTVEEIEKLILNGELSKIALDPQTLLN